MRIKLTSCFHYVSHKDVRHNLTSDTVHAVCLGRDKTSNLISTQPFKGPISVSLTASCDQYSVFIILTLILQPGRGGVGGGGREIEELMERGRSGGE